MEQAGETIGAVVRAWRKRAGLSVPQLAKMAGTSRQNLESLEKGRKPLWDLRPLARVMGYAKLDDLLELKQPPSEAPVQVAVEAMIAPPKLAKIEHAIYTLREAMQEQEPPLREALAALVAALLRDPSHPTLASTVLAFFSAERNRVVHGLPLDKRMDRVDPAAEVGSSDQPATPTPSQPRTKDAGGIDRSRPISAPSNKGKRWQTTTSDDSTKTKGKR